MKRILLAITAIFFGISISTAQDLEKKWIANDQNNIFETLELREGEFNADNASGDYLHQNKLLVFYFNKPTDSVSDYKIKEHTDSTLVFSDNNIVYQFTASQETEKVIAVTDTAEANNTNGTIVDSQGFSFESLWRGILGMISLIILSFLFSKNRRAINWKTVGLGLAFQLIIAIGVLKVDFIKTGFEIIGKGFISILGFTQAGSEFLFGGMLDVTSFGFIFAFQVLPTIIFFSALTSVLFYLGIIQKVVKAMGILLTKVLGISGAESLSVAGNIFLGQTEAPLLIKAYLEKMNRSEILLVMIGGMATVAGAVLAAYIGFLGGDDEVLQLFYAKHLLAASVMAAPGAIVISKILYPQTEEINTDVRVSSDKIGSNFLDAIANGTTEGLKLAVNVGAMLLVFVAFIAMVNGILGGAASFDGFTIEALNIDWHFTSLNEVIANNTPYQKFSLEFILGYVFAPLMWLIGVAKEDMALMGQLLGIKLAASEFIGYIQLADLKNAASATHLTYNKSIIMATYMLCGFANFASIGIQIGGIGSLAPGQRKTLSEFGIKALIGGTIASLMSATIAGMIIG
ncbi:NupC/NupG family nucleoside CNT transporter [Oceanihabitans sediminis]|uniref:Na+ dependent nucleoside transporter n=1 Tax=Oceanihabitans sediminis TaxID=1812012 RepID=A0A368P522_9FLAO|nr:nucleoside transporter C-terminal domain-containing protein [Oceanihabitans sediminis]MDX1278399.1 nucleoside transporter C-terminal domain-containing protein [Oceanihabitans sediminis]MDX1772635.1 nucleoside transporter C-terminal domain-containing protein [Oceanihabitans sediminis]RBP34302.1 CNT family concentrative nucleoside transporter [Oceanihabitans sediminis]RCU57987.1 Na+ dependent nucleoside transporter [Oceanihabitans sediminis]